MDPTQLIKQANAHFQKQEFAKAREYYQRASKTLGLQCVKVNLWLCEKRMSAQGHATARPESNPLNSGLTNTNIDQQNNSKVIQQLAHTQALLEHYYNQTQQLQNQIQDANS